MIQYLRSNGIPTSVVTTKLLGNPTPNLPSGVIGFVRIKGTVSASMILRLLPSAGGTSTGYIITPDGDILLTPDGNYGETPDHV